MNNHLKFKNMKAQYFSIFLLVFPVFSIHAAKKPDAKSVYLQQMSSSNAIVSLTDFQSVEKGKALVKMFHNEESVQVQIAVPDESMQTKFLMQGLKVYLDISGKKSKKYCIQFPKLEREQMWGNMQQRPEPGQQNMGRQGQMPMDLKRMLETVNVNNAALVNGKNQTALESEKANIQWYEEKNLVFTVYLPLSLLGDKIGKNRIISVGLSAEMEVSQNMGPGGGGMRPDGGGGGMRPDGGGGRPMGGGGGGAPMGGGARAMGGGGGGSAFAEMGTPFNTWVTFGVE